MWKPFTLEARYELLKLARMPVFAGMALGFPIVFYLVFGVLLSGSRATGGRDVALPMLASYSAFGVIGAALFSFGVGVAVERAQGWFLLKRATPMPPVVYVLGKVAACMAFCGIVVLSLALCGIVLAGIRLPLQQWVLLTGALTLGSIPFCAIGLAVGFAAGPNAAPGLVNLVHLPGAFAGGLWIPLEILPAGVKSVAPWLPQYHLGQLAASILGTSIDPHPLWNAVNLAIWTVVAVALAAIAFKRDEGKLYG